MACVSERGESERGCLLIRATCWFTGVQGIVDIRSWIPSVIQPLVEMFLQLVSALLGWSYTCLWSLSFWPQTINNYRRKSVTGFSQDFAHLNLLGFTSYATYNLAFLVSKTIQEQYRDRHAGHSHVVRWNDAAFAVHAAVLGAAQVAQSWFYAPPGSRQSHSARLSRFAIVSLSVLSLLIVAAVVVAWTNDDGHQSEGSADAPKLVEVQWLDVVNLLSYVKLYVTLVKYLPQINLNRRRKSTRGFSIESILLDFSGGLLSLLQLVIDAGLINHDWSAVTGDFGKL